MVALLQKLKQLFPAHSIGRLSSQWVAIGLTLLFVVIYIGDMFSDRSLLDTIEHRTYDTRLLSLKDPAAARNVAIVSIDERSLNQVGRWPWNRNILAELITKIDEDGARTIASDIFFPEAQNPRLSRLVSQLHKEHPRVASVPAYRQLDRLAGGDDALARAIRRSGKVILSMVFLTSKSQAGHMDEKMQQEALDKLHGAAVPVIHGHGGNPVAIALPYKVFGVDANIPPIQRAGLYAGHINTMPDADGTLRWTPLVLRYHKDYYPAADVQAVRAFLGNTRLVLDTDAAGIRNLRVGSLEIPTDEEGRVLVHYYGPQQTFPTLSAVDVLQDKIAPDALRGKIVLLGSTAVSVGDLRVTPYSPSFPGVEVRATIIQNLLNNDFIQRPRWMTLIDLLLLLVLGLGLSFVFPRTGLRVGGAILAGTFAALVAVAMVLFDRQHIWLNVTYPSLLLLTLFVATTVLHYFRTEGEKRQIKGAFQHYVAATVVEEIMGDIDQLRLGGEKRELTVLFSDIRGFTTVSEQIPPEEMVKLLNTYLTRMTQKVFDNHGTLDKYIGDAIMAFYGAPIALEDHALLACQTALDMMKELMALRTDWVREQKPLLDIGIGINTGPMIVGNMGSEERFDYTVIGDAVNLGSRLEHLNKTYGTNILLSEFTYEHVKDADLKVRQVDVARVRGRKEPVGVYELIIPGRYTSLDWLQEFERARLLFEHGATAKARPVFDELADDLNDPVSRLYVQRCDAPQERKAD
jgi:adenylate cyclase